VIKLCVAAAKNIMQQKLVIISTNFIIPRLLSRMETGLVLAQNLLQNKIF